MIFSTGLSKKLVLPAVASIALALGPSLFGQAETGEAIYKRNCAGCHGADGSGQTAMGRTFKLVDLRSAEPQKMTDAQLAEIVTKGKNHMPAYDKKLSHEQIQSVVGYLRELAKKK
jgi:cytochrome c oxidase cbb3-type subunit 3